MNGAGVSQPRETDQFISRVPSTERGPVKIESSSSTPAVSTATPSVAVTATVISSVPLPPSTAIATTPATVPAVVSGPTTRPSNPLEKKSLSSEKKNIATSAKVEVTNSTSMEKKPSIASPVERKPVPVNPPGPALVSRDVESTGINIAPNDSLTKLELGKRYINNFLATFEIYRAIVFL